MDYCISDAFLHFDHSTVFKWLINTLTVLVDICGAWLLYQRAPLTDAVSLLCSDPPQSQLSLHFSVPQLQKSASCSLPGAAGWTDSPSPGSDPQSPGRQQQPLCQTNIYFLLKWWYTNEHFCHQTKLKSHYDYKQHIQTNRTTFSSIISIEWKCK